MNSMYLCMRMLLMWGDVSYVEDVTYVAYNLITLNL